MSPAEQALVAYLAQIKPRKIGFLELNMDSVATGWCADIHLDARYDLFTSECIFDDCEDSQAKLFLESFVSGGFSVSWSVSVQLCKLLSARGHLVGGIMDPLLSKLDWNSVSRRLLFLSYLAVREDGATLAGRLLDQVPDDGRDGLFLACHRLHSEPLDRKLMAKFVEWGEGGSGFAAPGQVYALEQFIAKWLAIYPYCDLETVIRLYFKHHGQD
jgi:hypothetical protein